MLSNTLECSLETVIICWGKFHRVVIKGHFVGYITNGLFQPRSN
jgi:hypothetical protein